MANIAKTKYTNQYIQNMSFDDELKVQMVEIIGQDGVLKNPATEAKQAEFSIPDFDEQVVDETDYDNITVTYKKDGSIVAVKTISVVGHITTIIVT